MQKPYTDPSIIDKLIEAVQYKKHLDDILLESYFWQEQTNIKGVYDGRRKPCD